MTTKRIITAAAAIVISGVLLAGCTSSNKPSSTASTSPSPTATKLNTPVAAPKSEDDAIAAAEDVLATWYKTRGAVNAAGGTDTAPLEELSTGQALQVTKEDAARLANGPLLNKDGKSIDGPAKSTGALTFEPGTAYGQTWNGVTNGLVTIDGCQDMSGYHITTHDGQPAMRPPHERTKLEYQVTYNADSRLWLVSKQVDLQATC